MAGESATASVTIARSLIGAPFRLHGRRAETGLDCVGVAALAFDVGDVPYGYSLRMADADGVAALIAAAGLKHVVRSPRAGDLILLRSGPAQVHLAVMTEAGFVHADASARRVVETPGAPRGALIGVWEQ
jgi:murein DD-endopeptidase / murein LD-carboxypeptidase